MSTVFVSHSSKDGSVARRICSALEDNGIPCWIASRDVGPGENFGDAIVEAIRSARLMLLVFTANANNSAEIKKELVLAGQHNLVVVPVRAEDATPGGAFAYELATRQWIDLFSDWDREIGRLSAWIRTSLAVGSPPAADALDGAEPAPNSRADARGTGRWTPGRSARAAEEFGGYSRASHEAYEGAFFLYRWSFSRPNAIFRAVVEIGWSDEKSRLVFREFYESGKAGPDDAKFHEGDVFISPYTSLVHLVTTYMGSVRTMTLTKMKTNDGIMRGIVSTQADEVAFFQPTVSSVVLRKARDYDPARLVSYIDVIPDEAEDAGLAREQLALTESRVIRVRFGGSWASNG